MIAKTYKGMPQNRLAIPQPTFFLKFSINSIMAVTLMPTPLTISIMVSIKENIILV